MGVNLLVKLRQFTRMINKYNYLIYGRNKSIFLYFVIVSQNGFQIRQPMCIVLENQVPTCILSYTKTY